MTASTLRAVLALAGLLICAGIAHATPPRPPAELQFDSREALAAAKAGDGAFRLPMRILVTDQAGDLQILVRLSTVDPLDPKELERASTRVQGLERGRKESTTEIAIPARREPGRYRVDIELTGSLGERRGVLDRKVVYLLVDREGQRLVSPEELRRLDQKQRREQFEQQLRNSPDRPDSRLLDPATIRVPDSIAAKVAPIQDRPQLGVRGSGVDATLKRYTVDRAGKNWREVDPITVRGRLVYLDFEGTWRPLVNASVNLFDDDTFGDEHLGTTVTDSNGNWSFTVDNDDGWLADGRDIYYRFHVGNTRFEVRDEDGDQYRWQSATHDDLDDGTVLDFGTETGVQDPTAMQVFGVINLGWIHITSSGGQDPGHVEVRHPTAKTNHTSGRVNVTSGDVDGPDSILHEYGHALMYRAFGNTSISPGGSHGFDDDSQDPGLAFSEGWATGFMLSFCPDGAYNWHEGTTESAGEWPTCTTQNDPGRAIERFSDGGNRVGERNEGRVAAAINDFRDLANDDNGGSEDRGRNGESDANSRNRISLATIYRDSMWGFVHHDFLEFWFTFAGNLGGTTRSQADDIMQYNWMSLPIDISCVASKVTASLSKDPESLLTGLRSFRDHALKPTAAGRRWIQSYYSNSPELATLLIRDAGARRAALRVIEHFSLLGRALGKRQELERLVATDIAVLPEDVLEAVETITRTIERGGSAELRRDLRVLQDEVDAMKGLTVAQAVQRAEREAISESTAVLPPVRPRQLNEGSRKADWRTIRKYLPPVTDRKAEAAAE